MDDQILGVSSKGENGWMTGCADFGNCIQIQVHSVSNVLLWLLEGCQYQDHISASDISPLSKSILIFQVCVNRRTCYMLQYKNTYVKKVKVHWCKYRLLITLLLHNVLHYYPLPWLHPNPFFWLALIRCVMKEGVKITDNSKVKRPVLKR